MKRHLQERQQRLQTVCEPGLLSILTAVWNGSPLRYFQQLANSLIVQNKAGHSEWVILDNGCVRPELLRYLEELRERSWIRIYRSEINLGVTGGLRFCLQKASSRYILPVDADDFLYPDALRIVTFFIKQNGYPALLYTDEDKIAAGGVTQPYFKPVWDPVLLANSAYIAHLGVVDRKRALELDAYSDGETEGSP
ncbi:MAG: glycosyltransferase, partial [Acidobacteriaceae bacterium]|nr:glycosyltransferase [Acidobacteriaceae bacterium]